MKRLVEDLLEVSNIAMLVELVEEAQKYYDHPDLLHTFAEYF